MHKGTFTNLSDQRQGLPDVFITGEVVGEPRLSYLIAMSDTIPPDDLIALTASLVSSYVKNNQLPPSQLPEIIKTIFDALQAQGTSTAPEPELKPSVPIKRSVTPDHLICLEDGKSFKTLRRHLRVDHGMTPEEYRARWKLPDGYPMTAPGYAEQRSAMAKQSGLGRRSKPEPEPVVEPKRRGRKKAV